MPYGRDQAPIVLDSAKLSGNKGSFDLTGSGKPGGIYELIFGDNILAVPLINDASDIKVDIDLSKRDDFYKVEGSDASRQMQELITTVGKKNYDIEKSFAELDSVKRIGGADSLQWLQRKQKTMPSRT